MTRILAALAVVLALGGIVDAAVVNPPAGGGGVTSPVAGDVVATGKWTFGSGADAANSVRLGETAGCVVLEGATANAFETSLCTADPTADATFNLPVSGTGSFGIPIIEANNVWTGVNSFSATTSVPILIPDGQLIQLGTGTSASVIGRAAVTTPDSLVMLTAPTSNSVHTFERDDATFDFQNCIAGTSSSLDPMYCIHSHNQTTTEWIAFKHNSTDAVIDTGLGGLDFSGIVNGAFKYDRTITPAGTTGDRTIDKIDGTVNFAAAATTITVTNNLVNTSSIILYSMRTADTTCTFVKSAVPGAGSFVITLNAACAAETSVGFSVRN